MSRCISFHGEYSSHDLGDDFLCRLCGVLDEDALIDDRDRWRSAVRAARHEHQPVLVEPARLGHYICKTCVKYHEDDDQYENLQWPCPTVRAIDEALGGERG